MKRKIIQIANSTQLISLPRKWAKSNNLNKGDELEINVEDNRLIIDSTNEITLKRREIGIGDKESYVKYILHGLYKKGYDEVKLNFNDPTTISVIQEIIHKEMIGFEVVEQSSHSCVIRAIAGGFEKEFDTMFRRSFLLLKSMSKEFLDGLKNKDRDMISSLLYIENDINKYTCFCRRIINKTGYKEFKTLIYCLVDELERVADEYKYMFNSIIRNKFNIKSVNKDVIDIFEELTNLVDDAYTTYYKFNTNDVIKIFIKRKTIISKCSKFREYCDSFVLLHYAINIAQKIQDLMRFKLEIEL